MDYANNGQETPLKIFKFVGKKCMTVMLAIGLFRISAKRHRISYVETAPDIRFQSGQMSPDFIVLNWTGYSETGLSGSDPANIYLTS